MAGEGVDGLATVAGKEAVAGFLKALRSFADGLTENFASFTNAQPEDQLKAPVMGLMAAAGTAAGLEVLSRTEVRVAGIGGRPDLGVDVAKALTGNVELKAPGKGARPDRFKDKRSRDQFVVFSDLPNLIYTDGQQWALYTYGRLVGNVVTLAGDPTRDGAGGVEEADAEALLDMLGKFLSWQPVVPSSPRALAGLLAPVTRRLRDEVIADVKDSGPMAALYAEWKDTLFPDADVATFSDGYAQTFTYALLLARLEGAAAPLTAAAAAQELEADHALLAQVLLILGQPAARKAIEMPVVLLERLIGAVDAAKLSKSGDPWLYFYEHFLAAYDPEQRNNRGVYYTPKQVVAAQVRVSHQVLVDTFGKEAGFGDPGVVSLDPAVGTGTYPLTVIGHVIDQTVERFGEGMKGEVASRLARNLNGFELLVGPYAMTHLQVSRKLIEAGAEMPDDGVRVFLTDSLAAPADEGQAGQASLFQQRLVLEQERASKVKSPATNVTVVIGNPPWDRDESQAGKGVRRKGGMVRYGPAGSPGLLDDFLAPLRDAGLGGQAKNLYNDYVYFWRWAIWKVCEQNPDPGIVSFISAASYLNGPGFAGMREVMRRRFDEIWVVDLGGDGRGTRQDDNVFEGVITPAAIAFGIRTGDDPAAAADTPAVVRYRKITGTRAEKYDTLDALTRLDPDDEWEFAPSGWAAPFVPAGTAAFNDWPAVSDVLPWQHSGVKAGRTWVVSESETVLADRWAKLASTANEPARRALFKDSPTGRKLQTPLGASIMPGTYPATAIAGIVPTDPAPRTARYAFRSFDRQWILADPRLIDRPGEGWKTESASQIYLTSLSTNPLAAGPAVTVAAHIPDLHHFRGSYGAKDVAPLWRGTDATTPNITHGLLDLLTETHGVAVSPEDVAAYIFGLLGTGAYTARFADELATSTPRIPFTTDTALFAEVVAFGRDLLWWATHGERFNPRDTKSLPVYRLPAGAARNTKAVPAGPAGYPETFAYDPATNTIHVGGGQFGPVSPDVWAFEVSGLNVVQSWLGYRMKKRAGKKSSTLDDIRPDTWSFSNDLVELLWVIEHFAGAAQPAADLLGRVTQSELIANDAFPTATSDQTKPPAPAPPAADQQTMFTTPQE